ncbi:hypothetical protein GYMLUDRAFT_266073 [Collybiopsis luxurians FD-317 M1]|uniref:Unplaced genomic scaffold GYMLUscaffold_137, whole genome shotgun sequence n=1 Tax=Collybiopsis luxurians FD-317 M1 TaxID=944289 RepID=A0A0D0B988_9AGAR|nr:hypothetical protein GYMLUDRAFT_266073 [Collybiopsis luxurians FD-317 M1]
MRVPDAEKGKGGQRNEKARDERDKLNNGLVIVAADKSVLPKVIPIFPPNRIGLAKNLAHAAKVQSMMAGCPKDRELPERFHVDLEVKRKYAWYQDPQKIFFGFGLDIKDCFEYYRANREDFPSVSDLTTPSDTAFWIVRAVEARLTKLCRHRVRLEQVLSLDYDMVLYIYDSPFFQHFELEDHEEKEVVEILKEQVPVFRNQDLHWYYSSTRCYGGPAGCVVANRLSENPDFKVLLLEAGGSNEGILSIEVPFFVNEGKIPKDIEWNTTTIPQPSMNNRSLNFPHAFVLGGSTSHNNMIYSRGTKDDWDRFAQVTGDEGWSWDSIQSFIAKNERWTPPADNRNTTGEFDPAVHSTTGINAVSLAGFLLPLNSVALKASQELGGIFSSILDPNAGSSLGFSWLQFTINGGLRSSAATSYLASEFLKRSNLHVLINARVSRVLNSEAEPTTFRAVEFVHDLNGPKYQVNASKEVIISTGSINTPQILMNSGIGDSDFLSSLGINPLVHLPSVGQNMSVQPILGNIWNVNPDAQTLDVISQNETVLAQLLEEWMEKKQGPLVDSGGSQGVSFRFNSSILEAIGEDPSSGQNSPHASFQLVGGTISNTPSTGKFLGIYTTVSCPTSRGTIMINSTNPFAPPVIDPKLLSTDFDITAMREAVETAFVFLSAPAWKNFIAEPTTALAQAVESDQALNEYIRNNASPTAHVIGTASMTSPDADYGVVNPDLSVKGLTGLRVVDSSILPFPPSGQTQAPVYILAERASALIKEKWGSNA